MLRVRQGQAVRQQLRQSLRARIHRELQDHVAHIGPRLEPMPFRSRDDRAQHRRSRARAGTPQEHPVLRGEQQGGQTAAVLMSLCTTCENLGIDPRAYLRDVLGRISTHPANRIDELLPIVGRSCAGRRRRNPLTRPEPRVRQHPGRTWVTVRAALRSVRPAFVSVPGDLDEIACTETRPGSGRALNIVSPRRSLRRCTSRTDTPILSQGLAVPSAGLSFGFNVISISVRMYTFKRRRRFSSQCARNWYGASPTTCSFARKAFQLSFQRAKSSLGRCPRFFCRPMNTS